MGLGCRSKAIRILARMALAFGLSASLASCGHDPYPQGWAPVKTKWVGCLDLTGTYFLGVHGDDDASRVLGNDSLFSRLAGSGGITSADVLTIEQDAGKDLHFRLGSTQLQTPNQLDPRNRWSVRARVLSDAEFAKALSNAGQGAGEIAVIPRARQHCSRGWLELPGGAAGPLRLAVDEQGFLVAQAPRLVKAEVPLWCGDGCKGIPLGDVRMRNWARFVTFTSAALTVDPGAGHARTVGGRFDAGPVRASDAGPPLDPATAATVFETIAGMVPRQVRSTPVAAYAEQAEVTLSAATRDILAGALDSFDAVHHFTTFDVSAYGGADESPQTVRLHVHYVPFRTDAQVEPLREDLIAHLPPGATLLALQGRQAQFFATIRVPTSAAQALQEQLLTAKSFKIGLLWQVGRTDADGNDIYRVPLNLQSPL